MSSHPPIRLDLTRQKLLIKPDDPLPRFHPPPQAIMVTPIYDYGQIGLDESRYASGANGSWYPRDSSHSARHPSLMYYPTDPTEYRHGRASYNSDDHRHSRYQRPSSLGSDDRAYSDSDTDSFRDYRGRRSSSYSPPPRRLKRRDSHYDNRGRDPHSYDDDYSHRYSSYPHSYNQSRIRTRERPSDDPIAQHPPDYQVQATHQGQNAPGRAPSQDTVHSFGRYSQNTPYPFQPTGSALSNVSDTGGEHVPTSASLYAGRSPFYPPGQGSASRPGSHLAPSVMGGHAAPSLMSAATGHHHHVLDDVVRAYLKLIPPHPKWKASKLTGRKKAVCIGINYVGQDKELRGCFNDAKSVANFLITRYKFPPDQVLLLTDADKKYRLPTRKEMFSAFMWLVDDAQANDSLFFHYSGHGGQSPDASGREADGMDDTIFPVDFQAEGNIIDDELHDALVRPLPAGCRLTALFDSCHSGTVLDLPYLHSAHGRLRGIQHITARARQRKSGEKSDVICFAACKDDETSADTFEGGVAVGAMSHAFVQCLEQQRQQNYEQLLANLRETLIPKYHQKPQISGTNPLDVEQEFAL